VEDPVGSLDVRGRGVWVIPISRSFKPTLGPGVEQHAVEDWYIRVQARSTWGPKPRSTQNSTMEAALVLHMLYVVVAGRTFLFSRLVVAILTALGS
jgi:hypothetical protein